MEKVIKNGKVAVLISYGFGAGWYTQDWRYEELLFHPLLVKMVEEDRQSDITKEWVKDNLGIDNIYCDLNLAIEWIKEGTPFKIQESDGVESIVTLENFIFIA